MTDPSFYPEIISLILSGFEPEATDGQVPKILDFFGKFNFLKGWVGSFLSHGILG